MPHEQAQIVAWRPVNGYWFDPHFPQHPTLHSVKGTSVIPRKIDSNYHRSNTLHEPFSVSMLHCDEVQAEHQMAQAAMHDSTKLPML